MTQLLQLNRSPALSIVPGLQSAFLGRHPHRRVQHGVSVHHRFTHADGHRGGGGSDGAVPANVARPAGGGGDHHPGLPRLHLVVAAVLWIAGLAI